VHPARAGTVEDRQVIGQRVHSGHTIREEGIRASTPADSQRCQDAALRAAAGERGPYAWVRNPRYLGAGVALSGASLVYRPLLGFAAAFFLVAQLFVVLYEEPVLRRSFGAEYDSYCRRGPAWVAPAGLSAPLLARRRATLARCSVARRPSA
jgi:hypothetical protein